MVALTQMEICARRVPILLLNTFKTTPTLLGHKRPKNRRDSFLQAVFEGFGCCRRCCRTCVAPQTSYLPHSRSLRVRVVFPADDCALVLSAGKISDGRLRFEKRHWARTIPTPNYRGILRKEGTVAWWNRNRDLWNLDLCDV